MCWDMLFLVWIGTSTILLCWQKFCYVVIAFYLASMLKRTTLKFWTCRHRKVYVGTILPRGEHFVWCITSICWSCCGSRILWDCKTFSGDLFTSKFSMAKFAQFILAGSGWRQLACYCWLLRVDAITNRFNVPQWSANTKSWHIFSGL